MRKHLSLQLLTVFLSAMFITRGALLAAAIHFEQIELSFGIIWTFLIGLIYDVSALSYALPLILLISCTTSKNLGKNAAFKLSMIFIGIYVLLFNGISEMIFWEEFGTRFNFIAVDYLVYSHEVIKNIYESYPLIKILLVITLCSILLSLPLRNFITEKANFKEVACSILLLMTIHLSINDSSFELSDRYENEIAHNGMYNLFSAFKNNSLNYQSFYNTIDTDKAFAIVREKIGVNGPVKREISRFVDNGKPTGYNVVLLTIESLNANYLSRFGNNDNITPNLDALIKESYLFTNIYATGTRTVRGLEAITLSTPPTPGNSIVRQPGNENLFSLGSVLANAGYDLNFIYGGYGYFDNMNYFFSNNHFNIVDRSSFKKEDISFSNVWGVADEDVYNETLRQSDASFAKGKNFLHFIMTTSNHRPYTYPDGRINIPSGTNRAGAVTYTDYAIGKFIEAARKKPWFDNTIFVITADHCAGSSGKMDLPVSRYHIPLIIYAPKLIKPKEIDILSSQIDIAPTILNLLGISYESRFYGNNILQKTNNFALVGTYQKMGYYTNNNLVVLNPKSEISSYTVDGLNQTKTSANESQVNEAISFYQTAYYLFNNKLMKEHLDK